MYLYKEMIGLRIKELRLTKTNLSQNDFAKRIGVDRTYLSRIESGKQNITLDTIVTICSYLGVSLSDFFEPFKDKMEVLDEK